MKFTESLADFNSIFQVIPIAALYVMFYALITAKEAYKIPYDSENILSIRDLFHIYLNKFEFHLLRLHINKTNKFAFSQITEVSLVRPKSQNSNLKNNLNMAARNTHPPHLK